MKTLERLTELYLRGKNPKDRFSGNSINNVLPKAVIWAVINFGVESNLKYLNFQLLCHRKIWSALTKEEISFLLKIDWNFPKQNKTINYQNQVIFLGSRLTSRVFFQFMPIAVREYAKLPIHYNKSEHWSTYEPLNDKLIIQN